MTHLKSRRKRMGQKHTGIKKSRKISRFGKLNLKIQEVQTTLDREI